MVRHLSSTVARIAVWLVIIGQPLQVCGGICVPVEGPCPPGARCPVDTGTNSPSPSAPQEADTAPSPCCARNNPAPPAPKPCAPSSTGCAVRCRIPTATFEQSQPQTEGAPESVGCCCCICCERKTEPAAKPGDNKPSIAAPVATSVIAVADVKPDRILAPRPTCAWRSHSERQSLLCAWLN